jgi:hypothetical protein
MNLPPSDDGQHTPSNHGRQWPEPRRPEKAEPYGSASWSFLTPRIPAPRISAPIQLCNPDLPKSQSTLTKFYNTSCFAVPATYTYGNSGRNTVEGPGQVNFDFALLKNFHWNRDATGNFKPNQIQFRTEFFNILNTPQFNNPNRILGTPQFGSVTTEVNYPRVIQLALKFMF